MNQYIRDKLEELERLKIDISDLPPKVEIKDIEIGKDNQRYYAVITYVDGNGEQKEYRPKTNQYNIKDIFQNME
ncbi:MAG: hypothetical protein U9O55_03205 [Patescibacteria group bacterium]|nr:hypothetical protein [Patescibacteria group bacterium]